MFWLILGVLIWTVIHLFPSVMMAKRKELMDSFGNKYRGIYAGVIVFSVILMVIGWRSSSPDTLYNAPAWGRHFNMIFMLAAIVLLSVSHGTSQLKQYVRHPMLAGVHIWALGHLLANGEIRSVILFGGLLIWSVLSLHFINKREGEWEKPTEISAMDSEIKQVVISLAVFAALALLHPYYTGMSLAAG